MQTGDLVILVANAREAAQALAISNAGGQTWTSETANTTNTTQRIFWARYNGTWSANPSVSFPAGGNATTVVMRVFRPTSIFHTWAVDVALTNSTFTAPPNPRDVTISGITTNTDGALVFAVWATTDDNQWGLQTAGWTNAGGTQYRNLDGNDASQSAAYKIMPTAGASGNVVNRQTANGGDAGNSAIMAFREIAPTFYSRASTAWSIGTTWSVAGCGGASAGAPPIANVDVVICNPNTVTLDTNTPSLGSLTIQSGGTLNIGNSGTARTLTVAGDVDNSGTLQYATAANHAINIGGQFTNAGGATFTSAAVAGARSLAVTGLISNAGTFRFAGTAAMTVTATGGISNSNIFDVSTVSNVSHVLTITGNLSNSGTVQLAPDADSFVNTTFDGTSQTVGGSAGSTFNNVTTAGTTALTFAQPLAISGTLTLAAGTTLNAGALSHTIAGNFTNNGATFDPSTGTVTFNGTGAKTIGGSTGTTFNNLATAGTATVTVTQPLTINGSLTLGNATTFTAGASSHSIAGNFSNNGATFSSTGTFTFNGGSAQVIGGTSGSTFNNLVINSAGISLSGVNATVSGVLTFTAGVVTTGANVLIVTGNCPGSVSRSSGHVAGLLRLRVPAGSPTCLFPVGGPAGYRPVSIAFTTVTGAGDVTASVTQIDGEHPNIGTSTIETAYNVNRYWTLASSGTMFTSAVATFNYLGGDVDAGTDQTAFIAGRYAAGWTYPASTASAGSVQASGLATATLAGDYVLGETTPVLFSHWRMDQTGGWNGTPGEVLDSGTGGFNGTASGLVTRPTTSSLTPAIAGSPGTCGYGVFTRSNKDYVALPGGYPNLAAAAGGFTITAWINTTDSALNGQRIFIDDETNASPGGWGFSVGETTAFGAGGLRFYYRQPTVFILDTVPIPSNQWLFVALSVQLAAGVNASTATIYAYDTSGALVTSNTGTFTWTAGTDPGASSIGGETNASGEGTNAFGFSGNLDEVRVYQRALSQQRINVIRQDTRACAFLNHIRIEHDGIGLTCTPKTVTVKACADAACSSTYSGAVTTTLTPTGWVGGDTINFSGSTTVDLRRTTAGVVTVGAPTVSTVPAPASSARCFNGLVESCDIDFKDTGFLFSAIPSQIAGTTSGTHTVQAVRTDNSTGACVGLFNGNVPNIELASECVNPGTCAGQQVTFSNSITTAPIAANDGGAVSSWTTRTVNFGANSTADFTFSYPDVGAMRLHARYNINGSGNYMAGASSSFVVKPAGFTVTNIRRASDNFANPAATDAAGAVFIKAGEDIALTVTAVNSLNAATPNFGKETPAEGVKLTSALVPGLGLTTDPGLGNGTIAGSAFTAGAAPVSNVTWSEVGIIRITPSIGDSDYLGAGNVTGTATGNIGRFTPYQFAVTANAPSFAAACGSGGFTYIGQRFVYDPGMEPVLTVTAQAKGGVLVTSNYKGTSPAAQAFFRITNASLTGKAYTAATGTLDASGVTAPDPVIVDNGNGTATLTFNAGTGLFFDRAAPVAPFDAEVSLAINVVDADAVAFPTNPARIGQPSAGNGIAFSGGKAMRYGRLRLGGASGSQLLALRLPVTAQYWNGTFFVTNAGDSCTALTTTHVGLGNHLGTLNPGDTLVSAVTSPLAAGVGAITLSAPGAGNKGSVDVAVNLGTAGTADACPAFAPTATGADKSYLRGQWCGASPTRDPAARARFGIRRGGSETIYIRESIN